MGAGDVDIAQYHIAHLSYKAAEKSGSGIVGCVVRSGEIADGVALSGESPGEMLAGISVDVNADGGERHSGHVDVSGELDSAARHAVSREDSVSPVSFVDHLGDDAEGGGGMEGEILAVGGADNRLHLLDAVDGH